ncbi:MAG TPA: PilZ domain-containing protein [Thermoanaerobaculia bacterium]|nr:PilZ domain-containing protein [Thermoanaerobaculia bacterium]
MDSAAGGSPADRGQRRAFPRVPLRAKTRMEFAEQRFFLSEWAVNLSPGGMFVRSEAPMGAGQRFQFEASLTPKGPRFEGVGEVMWVRTDWEGNARPPGFAVRFLELEEAGREMMVRLAAVFLERGVGAMQEELQAMSAAWQRRRLDDENTDEIHPVPEAMPPLADTAVIDAPWAAGLADEVEATVAAESAAEDAPNALPGELTVTAPLAVEPGGEKPGAEKPGAEKAGAAGTVPLPGRRRVWWVGIVALALLGGSGYLVARGSLPSRIAPAEHPDERSAEAAAPLLPPAPPAAPATMPASARTILKQQGQPAAFAGLDDVRFEPVGEDLWVVLTLDGELPPEAVHAMHPDDPPREVIQLLGARRGYEPATIAVGSPLLSQIRVGFHPGGSAGSESGAAAPGPPRDGELHVVLDLTSSAVVADPAIRDGRSLRVRLSRGPSEPAAPSGAAAPPTAAVVASPSIASQ